MKSPFPKACALKYEAQELLGSGGYGSVYLATQVSLGRPVALKILNTEVLTDSEQIQRFLDEAKFTASLGHPHIVVVLDHDLEDGVPWIAYEYLTGKTLRALLKGGALPVERALTAALHASSALVAAHERNVIHRDIKPDNIIEAQSGLFKVTDFGIARWTSRRSIRTACGIILGTPEYLAPELLAGASASAASDFYALGVTLYELLTGVQPYSSPELSELIWMHLHTAPVPPSQVRPEVPPVVDEIVLKLLAKAPTERYANAGEVASSLERAVAEWATRVHRVPEVHQLGSGPVNGLNSGVTQRDLRNPRSRDFATKRSVRETFRAESSKVWQLASVVLVLGALVCLVVAARSEFSGISRSTPPVPESPVSGSSVANRWHQNFQVARKRLWNLKGVSANGSLADINGLQAALVNYAGAFRDFAHVLSVEPKSTGPTLEEDMQDALSVGHYLVQRVDIDLMLKILPRDVVLPPRSPEARSVDSLDRVLGELFWMELVTPWTLRGYRPELASLFELLVGLKTAAAQRPLYSSRLLSFRQSMAEMALIAVDTPERLSVSDVIERLKPLPKSRWSSIIDDLRQVRMRRLENLKASTASFARVIDPGEPLSLLCVREKLALTELVLSSELLWMEAVPRLDDVAMVITPTGELRDMVFALVPESSYVELFSHHMDRVLPLFSLVDRSERGQFYISSTFRDIMTDCSSLSGQFNTQPPPDLVRRINNYRAKLIQLSGGANDPVVQLARAFVDYAWCRALVKLDKRDVSEALMDAIQRAESVVPRVSSDLRETLRGTLYPEKSATERRR